MRKTSIKQLIKNNYWVNIKCMDVDRLVYKSYLNSYLLFESEDSKEFK